MSLLCPGAVLEQTKVAGAVVCKSPCWGKDRAARGEGCGGLGLRGGVGQSPPGVWAGFLVRAPSQVRPAGEREVLRQSVLGLSMVVFRSVVSFLHPSFLSLSTKPEVE